MLLVALALKYALSSANLMELTSHLELSHLTTYALLVRGPSAAFHAYWLHAPLSSIRYAQSVQPLPLSQPWVEGC